MSKQDLLGPKSDAVSGARALLDAKTRRLTGKALVEGEFAVSAALAAGWVDSIYALPNDSILNEVTSARVYLVNNRGLAALSDTVTGVGPVAVITIPRYELADLLNTHRFIVIADEIADPGNLGTLIRSAAAFGATGLVTTAGSADLWSGKVLRSTVGTFTQIALLSVSRDQLFAELSSSPLQLLVAAGEGEIELASAQLNSAHAWVIGNEAHGVHRQFRAKASQLVRIPTVSGVESLNAAVAGSICMYESANALPRIDN